MEFLKRFNREQLTLGAAGLLGVLLFGWQLARGGVDGAGGELPTSDRVYSIARQVPIEFIDPRVDRYLVGRDIWEPPAAGRLPIPEIRPPEPRLGQMMLPPFSPRPDDTEPTIPQPGRYRTVAPAAQANVPPGFPAESEIAALKDLAEVDLVSRVVDRRKQLMRPDGHALIHLQPPKGEVVGRIILDSHETSDQSIVIERQVEGGTVKMTIKPDEIDRSAGGDAGVERGGEYGKEYLRRAGRLKPDDAEGHRRLGEWCRKEAGMLPEARTALAAAVEALSKRADTGPRLRDAVLQLVEIQRDLGHYDEGIGALQDYIESVKGTGLETADLHLRLGRLYAELGYHERSLLCYDAAFNLSPGRPEPRIALARARLKLGESRLALEQINALLVAGGTPDPEALVVQGLGRLRQGQAQEAEDSFLASLQARPDHAEALNGLGVALALQSEPEAPAKFLAAIKADQYLIDAWINLATLYLAAGRPVEAEILFSGAAQRDPASSTAAAGPGFVAVLKGSYAEAASAFERALKIQPDDYFMSYALGRLKLREGRAPEALDLFRQALKSNPEYLPATTDAALAYLMLAREEQRLASSAPADRAAPFRERAEAYRINAQTLLETSYRSDPTSHAANVALGCVYAVRGRAREANSAFDRAGRPGIPDPLIDYGRGYVEYWYGADSPKARLDLADVRFKFGASHTDLKEPADQEWAKECAKALESIDEWRVQRILIDERFDGSRPSLANAWIPVQVPPDPAVRYANDRAVLGDATGIALGGAFVALEHRDIPRDFFLSVEGTLVLETSQGFEAGFSLYTGALKAGGAAGGMHFVILEDPTGLSPRPLKVYYGQIPSLRDKGPSRPNRLLGTLPAAPTRVRFKLERREHPTKPKTWLFQFSVWDDAKGDWRVLGDQTQIEVSQQMADAPTMMMQFWGRTLSPGRKWSLGVDDVRVIVTAEK